MSKDRPRLRLGDWAFTWDPDKAETNIRDHGVSFLEGATCFFDPYGVDGVDGKGNEKLIAYSEQQRLLLTVYLEVEGGVIRIISAWRATRAERDTYEERDGGCVSESRHDDYVWRRNPYAFALKTFGIRVLASALPRSARSLGDWLARRPLALRRRR